MTQCKKLERLLSRKKGATSMEIIQTIGSVSPHARMSELKRRGWAIWSERVPGKTYLRYFGAKAVTIGAQ